MMDNGHLTLDLPVPPTVNEMIGYAKKRTRKTKNGGWLTRAAPIVYDKEKSKYEEECYVILRNSGVREPKEPWPRWRLVSAHFRVWNERDWTELAAGLKWVIDMLVKKGFVEDDSPREMERPETWPTQEIDRKNQGVVVEVERVE